MITMTCLILAIPAAAALADGPLVVDDPPDPAPEPGGLLGLVVRDVLPEPGLERGGLPE
jgi:hypothetical protein